MCQYNTVKSYQNFTSTLVDNFVNSKAASLQTTIDAVAPLKKKKANQRWLAPWYDSQTSVSKHTSRKLERKWRSTGHILSSFRDVCFKTFHLAWKGILINCQKALRNARTSYYSLLNKKNKKNPSFLLSTVARLTESPSSTDPSIPLTLRSNNFMNFFTNKITITGKIPHLLTMTSTDTLSNTETKEPPVAPDLCLDHFSSNDLSELTWLVSSSKPTSSVLDSVLTRIFKEDFPLIRNSILNQINMFLSTGYVQQAFKVAAIKPVLKKETLVPDVLANYRPISNLPFISQILEKAVANQLCDYLDSNGLFEDFQSGFRIHHGKETALRKSY